MSKNKSIILSAHQPVYLPWLGLFHKIALADIFCVFDIVQYQRKDFNNRNKRGGRERIEGVRRRVEVVVGDGN